MVLALWVASSFDPDKRNVTILDESQLSIVTRGSAEHHDLIEGRAGRVRTEYIAKGRESLESLAKKFGVSSRSLARINRISHDRVLSKGDKIIVYQVVDPSRSDIAEDQWKKTPRGRRGKVNEPRAVDTASTKQDISHEDDESSEGTHTSGGTNGPVTKPAQVD
jgi:hypothetical protein